GPDPLGCQRLPATDRSGRIRREGRVSLADGFPRGAMPRDPADRSKSPRTPGRRNRTEHQKGESQMSDNTAGFVPIQQEAARVRRTKARWLMLGLVFI